LVASTF